jgi:hypothetical protein
MIVPPEAAPLLAIFTPAFTQPTAARFTTLIVGALLTTGRRTVANLLRTLRPLATGHPSDYQRVLSRAPWSPMQLGCGLATFILRHLIPTGPVVLGGGTPLPINPSTETSHLNLLARERTGLLLRRPHGCSPLDLGRKCFSTPLNTSGDRETAPANKRTPTLRACACTLITTNRQKSS